MGIAPYTKQIITTVNSTKSVQLITLDFSALIASGGFKIIDTFAPVGYISKIQRMDFQYSKLTGAISGAIGISVSVPNGIVAAHGAQVDFNGGLMYWNGQWITDTGTNLKPTPTDLNAQYLAQSNLSFDSVNPLRVKFSNITDVSDVGTIKDAYLWVVNERVA